MVTDKRSCELCEFERYGSCFYPDPQRGRTRWPFTETADEPDPRDGGKHCPQFKATDVPTCPFPTSEVAEDVGYVRVELIGGFHGWSQYGEHYTIHLTIEEAETLSVELSRRAEAMRASRDSGFTRPSTLEASERIAREALEGGE